MALHKNIILFFILLLGVSSAFAGNAVPHLLPFQGRLTDTAGLPVNYPVTVKFRIYPPSGTCYIYEDTQNLTPSAYGIFSVLLGGSGNSSGPTNTFAQVFNNDVVSIPDSCAGIYVPATNDWRRIEIVIDGEVSPDMQTIGAAPFAINTNFLEGKAANQFVQIQGNLTQSNAEALVGAGDASSLHHHDSLYAKIDGSNSFTGTVGTSGDIYTTTGKVGVGTSTANADVDILKNSPTLRLGSVSGSGGASKIDFYSGTTTQRASIQSSESTNVLKFFTGTSEALRLDGSQNAIFAGSIQVAGTIGPGKYNDAQETGLVTSLTALGSLATGTLWSNTTSMKLKYWDGTQVQVLANGASVVNSLTAGTGISLAGTATNPIINVSYGNSAGTAIEGNASFGGDVSGTFDNLAVNKLRNKSLESTAPSTMGQVYFYDSISDQWKLSQATAPTDSQILKWNNSSKKWEPSADLGWIAADATTTVKGIMRIGSGLADGGSGLVNVNFTTTGQSNKILSLDGSGVANVQGIGLMNTGTVTLSAQTASATYGLKFPAAAPAANQSLQADGSGNLSWVTFSGDATISNTGVVSLKNTGTAGTYGAGNKALQVTTDAQGRITSVSELTIDDSTKLALAGGTMTGAIAMGAHNITNTGNITMAANKYLLLSANSTDGSTAGQIWYDSGTIKYFDGTTVRGLAISGSGVQSINGSTINAQSFASPGTSGTAPAWSTNTGIGVHTLNIPMASTASVTAGLISKTEFDLFNSKQGTTLTSANIWVGNVSGDAQARALSGDVSLSNTGAVSIVNSAVTNVKIAAGVDAAKISGGSVSNTEFDFLDGVTSAIQTQLSSKLSNSDVSGDATVSNTGVLTLKNTGTAGTYGSASLVPIVTTDAQGRVTGVTTAAPLDATKLPLAGGTMTGAIAMGAQNITNTGNITMAANKYFSLSANSTNGTAAGQLWYDAGLIKYFDGSVVKSLGVAGDGITSLNGLTGVTQTFAVGASGNSPAYASSGTTHTLNIPMASTSSVTAGLISKTDYDTFNAKQATSLASAKVWVGNGSGVAAPVSFSGDATIDNAGALTIANSAVTNVKVAAGVDAAKISGGSVSNTEFDFLDGVTSAIQTQFASKLSNTIASGKILVGNASNVGVAVDVSGDATIDNAGALTLASTITAGTKGLANKVPQITYDAKGRLTTVTEVTIDDSTKLPLAGGTMNGAIAMGTQNITNTGNITMAANKYFSLSANSTNGTAAGQMWYDAGLIKYFDGSVVKSLGVAGDGITSLNGLTGVTQTFAVGTSGTAPAFNSATSTHTLNIPMASTASVTAGLISKTDYDAFAGKQDTSLASAKVWVGNGSNVATAVSLSGDATISNAGVVTVDKTATGTSSKILALDGSGVANVYGAGVKGATSGTAIIQAPAAFTNYSLTLPVDAGSSGQVLSTNGSGVLSWASALTNSLASGKIIVGNGSNVGVAVDVSGDATISNAGALTLSSVVTAATKGDAQKVPQLTYDAKGRVTSVTEVTIDDNTKLPLAGGTMSGAIAMGAQNITNTGNITMAANKYLGLSANSTDGTIAGQLWYDSGTVKYFDGSSVKSLGVAGAGITSLNGLTGNTQTFAMGTSGTAPAFNSATTTHTLNIPMASTASVTAGLISKTDYDTFNAKQSTSLASAKVWVGNGSGIAAPVSFSGDATMDNAGAFTIANSAITDAKVATGIDAAKLGGGAVSNTEFSYLDGVTSAIQTQLTGKVSSTLSSGKILVGNASNIGTAVDVSGDATIDNAGALTLASTITAATKGLANKVPQITYDAKGRLTGVAEVTIDDSTKLPLAGGTMTGAIAMGAQNITNTGNITMAANKYFSLSANGTDGTAAGQMWYDSGTIKYFDGSTVKSLGIAGAGIASMNGLTGATQTFAIGTSGTAPAFNSATSTHTLNIPMASTASVTAGLISKTDYDAFAAKQDTSLASAKVWVGNGSNVAAEVSLSGDATISNAGAVTVDKTATGTASKILALDGSGVANVYGTGVKGATSGTAIIQAPASFTNYSLTLPVDDGTANQVLSTDGSGVLSWASVITAVTNSATLADGKMWLGNSSNKAVDVTISGDATIANTGALTLKNTGTAGTYGSASLVPIVTTDAQGRVTGVTTAAPLDATKLPLAGGTVTGDITMDNQKAVLFREASGSGTNYAKIQAPAALAGDYTLTLPADAGSSGQVLSTNGSGELSWAAALTNSLASGKILVGNASNLSAAVDMSGDATITNAGVITIANSAVTDAKVATGVDAAKIGGGAVSNTEYSYLDGVTSAIQTQFTGKLAKSGDTMTGALTMDNQMGTVYREATGGGTNSVTVRAPAAITTDFTLTLPTSAGTNLQFLQTDGSGNLAWATPATMLPSLADTKIWIGNGSSVAMPVSLSGDVTGVSNAGAVTIDKSATGTASKILALDGSGVVNAYGAGIKGATSGTAIIQAPASFTNYSLTLPVDDGTANQVLQTDGSGILSWATVVTAVQNSATLTDAKIWIGNSSNKAMELSLSGDATIANTGAVTLKNTGTAGTYYIVTTDAQGRVTSGTSLVSGDITTALSYTPVNKAGDTMTGTLNLASNGLTVGTTQLVVSGGNVGIGQTPTTDKLEVNGNIRATAFLYTSDRRLKKDFKEIAGLETILRLHGVSFKWKETNAQEIGLIAQEVEAVLPELVQTDKVTGFKSVKYGNLVAPLIEATKDLYGLCQDTRMKVQKIELQQARTMASVNTLEDKVRKLEEENNSLRKEVEEIKRLIKYRN